MVVLNDGKMDLETEILLEISLANLDELGAADADEQIDAYLEITNAITE